MTRSTVSASRPAYGPEATRYDVRTSAFQTYRRMLVDALPLRRGDVVIDVGCGTGLCFPLIRQRIGPEGRIVGVDASPDMLAIAAERVAAAAWTGVELVEAPVEHAPLPEDADHALFCAVHDVLQSPAALDNVLAHVRASGSVAAGGGKWGPSWALALNASVMALHSPFVADFTGFDRPWARLAQRVPDLRVRQVALGAGYLAVGRVAPGGRTR